MTMNRSSAVLAAPQPGRPTPHLRVCPPADDPRQVFSADELVLVSLFAEGLCTEVIARRLELSDRTIRRRSRALCDRLGVSSTIQVVAWAARRQLI